MISPIRDSLGERLLLWFQQHGRDYPWRSEHDPFRLAVTELLLVRTRADQVARVWTAFFAMYPTAESLADAAPGEVEEHLKPLGLQWRAALVRARAVAMLRPEILAGHLPGNGSYVKAATGLALEGIGPLPVDVTIARLLTRFYGLSPSNREFRRDRSVIDAARQVGSVTREEFHAILDLAALVCVPGRPRCEACPIRGGCATAKARTELASHARTPRHG